MGNFILTFAPFQKRWIQIWWCKRIEACRLQNEHLLAAPRYKSYYIHSHRHEGFRMVLFCKGTDARKTSNIFKHVSMCIINRNYIPTNAFELFADIRIEPIRRAVEVLNVSLSRNIPLYQWVLIVTLSSKHLTLGVKMSDVLHGLSSIPFYLSFDWFSFVVLI